MFMVYKLLEKLAEQDPTIEKFFDKMNIHFIPVVNPDGYQFSHTHSRMWRKNRFRNRDGSFGIDLNRNWIHAWGGPGSSRVPSSDIYCGPSPLSEVETNVTAEYIKANNIKAGIDYHSFGSYILRPYDYSTIVPRNENEHRDLGLLIQAAIRATHGTAFSNIRGAQMYIHSGGLLDTFYENFKIDRSLCLELRGNGFVLDPRFIVPSGEENYNGVIKVMEWVANLNSTQHISK